MGKGKTANKEKEAEEGKEIREVEQSKMKQTGEIMKKIKQRRACFCVLNGHERGNRN